MPTMINGLYIRPARLDDAQGIADLLRAIGWFAAHEGTTREDAEFQVRRLLESAKQGAPQAPLFLVAAHPGLNIGGYCAVHWLPVAVQLGWDAYVSELFVHADARAQRIGGQLLEQAVQTARERGCKRIWLVNDRNRESYQRGFYGKQGWSEQKDMARLVLTL